MFKPGQAYRAPNGFIWVVETLFEGNSTLYANGRIQSTSGGVVLFAVRELDRRVFIVADDPKLDKLKRIHGAEEMVA